MPHPPYISGSWHHAPPEPCFHTHNPATGQPQPDLYPISPWADLDAALNAAAEAAPVLARHDAGPLVAAFLHRYATLIERNIEPLVQAAHEETGLPISPRLRDLELPRTLHQLGQATAAAFNGTWRRPVVDSQHNIRSCLAPLGPVLVIGPNNFPFAYNAIAGGDFASALAAGNPVIAKGHPLHPTTTRLLAELAAEAADKACLPPGSVQLVYHIAPEDGLRLISDPRLAAVAFTGSRHVGLQLKAAADAAGKPFFAEMSSLNPVVILSGALRENPCAIAEQLTASLTSAAGQQCTKPGLVFLADSPYATAFLSHLTSLLQSTPTGPLFSAQSLGNALSAISKLRSAGAHLALGGAPLPQPGYFLASTLLTTTGRQFLADPASLQTEIFANAALVITASDTDELLACLSALQPNLTASIYAAPDDGPLYPRVAQFLRPRCGRLLNNKMPTGVTVSPAMNHGGPYPATSNPHFSAVGFPHSIARFTQLHCYDNVPKHRLPPILQAPPSSPPSSPPSPTPPSQHGGPNAQT
jgi:NADP-dependent aldehyde dehydrogenase